MKSPSSKIALSRGDAFFLALLLVVSSGVRIITAKSDSEVSLTKSSIAVFDASKTPSDQSLGTI
jgi:hypothetical protein